MPVNLLVDLVSRQADTLGVDHYYVIAAVKVRREARLVLADQKPRDARRETPQHLPLSIHHKPVLADRQLFRLPAFWNIRPHLLSHTFHCKDKRQV